MKVVITAREFTNEYQNVSSVILTATTGVLQIKSGHTEMFATLVESKCQLKITNKENLELPIKGGVCHVYDDVVTIIV